MKPRQSQALRKCIKRVIAAEVADSWKGGGDPEDKPEIERELYFATKALEAYIKQLTEKPK